LVSLIKNSKQQIIIKKLEKNKNIEDFEIKYSIKKIKINKTENIRG
jgi:hypothetical protein